MNTLAFIYVRAFISSSVSPLFLLVFFQLPTIASPCFPTDPTGNNPQNPCLVFPPPGVSSDTFIQGLGRPVREQPTVLHPEGRPILQPTGFWTGSTTTGQQRVIQDSSGKSYTLPKQ